MPYANTGNTAGVDIGTGTPIQTVFGYLPEDATAIAAAMDVECQRLLQAEG
ncbi:MULTISPECIES: hypothetical protein [unclassified Shewanella]|nr:hypothetical protein [Shewanella sp. MTB7]MEC4738734.1 hypothetical protein [Shewanella sp. E94]WBJ98326.1 hypothetical protein HWQ47_24890 [Shewanella sp. MTB7]